MKCNMSKTRLISQSINDEIKKCLYINFYYIRLKRQRKIIEDNKKHLEFKCEICSNN
ncbi:Uncharacterised protein [Photobacterium damselae]|nr:Uncharacterised protein [Photobacterium damselae]